MVTVAVSCVFVLHILSGAAALVAGVFALCAGKGGRIHRLLGDAFVIAMVVMALSAGVLGAIRPGQSVNIFIASLTLYLVATAWLTAKRGAGGVGMPEWVALAVSLALCAPFALIMVQIATGMTIFATAFRIEGAILVALCVFSAIMATAAMGDLTLVLRGGITGTARITRHLWRMCFALALTFGSAFTNGFARLLPGPYHVPPLFFVPQLLMLLALLYWLVRVRFPGWAGSRREAAGHPDGGRPGRATIVS